MRLLLLLLCCRGAFGQGFVLQQTTSFTIEYEEIALVRLDRPQLVQALGALNEAGTGILIDALSLEPQLLHITCSRNSAKSLYISSNAGTLMLVADIGLMAAASGQYTGHGPVHVGSGPAKLLEPSGGLATGTAVGSGIPLMLDVERAAGYGQLQAQTYWMNVQLEFL